MPGSVLEWRRGTYLCRPLRSTGLTGSSLCGPGGYRPTRLMHMASLQGLSLTGSPCAPLEPALTPAARAGSELWVCVIRCLDSGSWASATRGLVGCGPLQQQA